MSPIPRAAIVASFPPPLGGVASLMHMLHQALHQDTRIVFEAAVPKGGGDISFARVLKNARSIVRAALRVSKEGRVLFFSSSGASFYEKLLWAVLVQLFGRRPVLVMVDGNFPEFWSRVPRVIRWGIEATLRRRAIIGAQSQAWQSYYQKILPGVKCQIVGATVSSEVRDTSVPQRGAGSRVTVLYVGWVVSAKGVDDLLDAFARVTESQPNCCLRVVGPMFAGAEYWTSQAFARGLDQHVKFVGPVADRKQLLAELCAADVFVLPSHFEGFPVALLEAIWVGLPCIGSNVGGIPDILDYGSAGLVVPSSDAPALASAILSLVCDDNLRYTLGSNAAARARTSYNVDAVITSYSHILGLA